MRKNSFHVTASTDRTQLKFLCLTLDNVGFVTKHDTYSSYYMFCNKDTADEENTLELQKPATKN